MDNEENLTENLDSRKKFCINSENKRLESIKKKRTVYHQQKSVIQAALASLDFKNKKSDSEGTSRKNHISFVNGDGAHAPKKTLFSDDENDDDYSFNLESKTHFEGAEGQKLFALQSTFKNDARFKLDKRFAEKPDEDELDHVENDQEMSTAEEKKRELQLLEEVLGKKLKPNSEASKKEHLNKKMLRFDPTQTDHSKYELVNNEQPPQKKKKRNSEKKIETLEEQDIEQPQVSKDVFYKVNNNLTHSLQDKGGFSLMHLFDKNVPSEEDHGPEETPTILDTKQIQFENSFPHFDSSDEEVDEVVEKSDVETKTETNNMWSEPFFFTDDDYRLQEGADFIKRTATLESDFSKVRQDVKYIVKTKIRNNSRKDRPFKKKLGASKRKKNIRIKKALKK